MTVLISKQNKLNTLALTFSVALSGLCAQAAEYHPDDLSADVENEHTAGGHVASHSGVLNLQSPVNSTVEFFNKKIALNNGTISVDARFSADADPVQSHLGLLFNRIGAHTFWSLQINPSGRFMIVKCVNNANEYVHPSSITPALKKGTMVWNTLSIQTTDTTVKAFINGTEVYSGPHKFVAGGRIGLLSQDPGSADFKNFKANY
ncbi:MAG: hypothetical protein P4L53_00080 [Candidatus Obscuribacterales bacterium]|nr:hypothetical protein [Candidatus Obscuribacterales bacterium]